MNKEIKNMTHNDRKSNLTEQFREDSQDWHKKHVWKAVKNLKNKFTSQSLYRWKVKQACWFH